MVGESWSACGNPEGWATLSLVREPWPGLEPASPTSSQLLPPPLLQGHPLGLRLEQPSGLPACRVPEEGSSLLGFLKQGAGCLEMVVSKQFRIPQALLTTSLGDFNRFHILTSLAGQPNPRPHRP